MVTLLDKNFKGELSRSIDDYPQGLVLIVDKPFRWTSADVIRKIKYAACRHFGKKNLKVGHAGTLDPLASGVLVVCIGNACKQAQAIQATRKQYLAGICLGAVTASYDREKEVLIQDAGRASLLSRDDVQAALFSMTGPQDQIAPLFSAKSIDGVRAYEIARRLYREGRGTEEAAQLLNVNRIQITEMLVERWTVTPEEDSAGASENCTGASGRINVSRVPAALPLADVRIDCSKGTYIRSIARDLGETLGCGAFLYSLRRTRCGEFCVEDALGVDAATAIL